MKTDIKEISAKATYSLRQKVMNPELSGKELARPGDDTALHFGAFRNDQLIGIMSLYPQDEEENYKEKEWRIRGMAVDENYQGNGIGRELVEFGITHLQEKHGLNKLWCNAREGAAEFYGHMGFDKTSETYIKFPHEGIRSRMVMKFG